MPQTPPEQMSLDELEAQVLEKIQTVSDLAEQRYGVGLGAVPEISGMMEGAPAPMQEAAPAEEELPPVSAPEAPLMGVEEAAPPELVMAATNTLVEAGMLEVASDTLTPEVLAVIAQIAEQFAPGLYDTTNPAHVTEILDGIINGTIPVGTSAPEPGPEPAREPEPGPPRERSSGLPYGGVY